MVSQSPVYNLNVLVRETGISADLVRAWERRYGMPMPQRSRGGHRLYSQQDIEMVKWLLARQEDGLTISRAVALWREIEAKGRDPLAEYRAPAPEINLPVDGDTRVDDLRSRWLEACLNFDGIRAEEVLNQAFALYPVETVCSEVLQKGLHLIGGHWYEGKVSVQQEHFATAQAIRRLEALILATPHPTREKTLLLGCPSGEWHTFPVLMMMLFLRRRGLKVIYLGADIPAEQLEETAEAIRPDLIVLSAQHLRSAASLQNTVVRLGGWKLAYGGLIFNRVPRLRQSIPAHFLGEDITSGLIGVEQLLAGSVLAIPEVEKSSHYVNTIRLFLEKRVRIEQSVESLLQPFGTPAAFLSEANKYFGDGLISVMELGDMSFMEADMGWVRKLLSNRQIGQYRIAPYLRAYVQGIRDEMGVVGEPIANWIETYIAEYQDLD